MKINYYHNKFELCVTDEEVASFRDGVEEFYKLPKDNRPDLGNPHEYFSHVIHQANYKIDDIAKSYPLNGCPPELVEGLKNLEKIADFVEAYQRHILAIALNPVTPLKEKNNDTSE